MTSERVIVPGSWRLGGDRWPWPSATATSAGLTVGASLALAPTSGGPRSVRSPNGTLGGLSLPPALAVDAGVVWLLDGASAELRRFDPLAGRFVTVPGWGGASSGAQRFGRRAALAATCGLLALADPDRGRVVVARTAPLLVRAVLEPGDARPVAVAGHAGVFHVLDDRGRLWTTTPLLDRLERRPDPGRIPDGAWRRVVVDSTGRPWRVDDLEGSMLSAADGGWEVLREADALRPLVPAPAFAVDHAGRFRVPAPYRLAGSDAEPDGWFDTSGEACTVPPDEYAGDAPYGAAGWWTGKPFDSGVLGCRWHRITVTGTHPPGCATTVETYTSDERRDPADVPPDAWSPSHRVGPQGGGAAAGVDHAVLSPRGRHLVLRIGLSGDGWASPTVDRVLVEPEGKGLDRFLPAVYRSDDEDADFLRRFLAMFGSDLDRVEQSLRSLPARFSPTAAPDAWLDVLAAELGVPLERGWRPDQQRAMLVAAPRWHRRRGTPAALTALLRTHLEASTGRPLPDLPVLVEGFRERESALVGRTTVPMAAGERTWSDDVVGRPVLGRRHAERIRLVSVGDRLTDRFRVHAHRFSVVVPRPLLAGRDELERFERLVSAEKPAHVAHDLVLVEPRAVVGEQGLVGIDTFVGDWPVARLASGGCGGSSLGLGLRLGRRGLVVPPAAGRSGRVGVDAVVV